MRFLFSTSAAVLILGGATLAACADSGAQATPPPVPTNPPPDAEPPDAALPPVMLDPVGPYDPDHIARAAIFFGSCFSSAHPWYSIREMLTAAYSDIFWGNKVQRTLLRTAGCFADKVNGCKALEECTGIIPVPVESCHWGCSGSTYSLCNDTVGFHVPCDRLGLLCGADPTYFCDDGPPEPCVPGQVDPCKDGSPHLCEGPEPSYLQEGPPCSDYGLVCGIHSNGKPACMGDGASCVSSLMYEIDSIRLDWVTACDGTTVTRCVNEHESVADCSAIAKGFSCQTFMGGNMCGIGGECVPAAINPKCEGDSIVICNGGRLEKFDCKSLGFTGCNPTEPTLSHCF